MQLETNRLTIVPLELSLLRLLLAGRPQLEQTLGLTPSGLELDVHTHQAMADLAALAQRTPGAFPWITNWQIILKHRKCSIGSACFMDIPHDGEVEIGYGIDPPFRNQGIMSEALRAITGWALAQPGVIRVAAETELDNTASQRLLACCGFRPVSATRWLLCKSGAATFRQLSGGELSAGLFATFHRYQPVKRCWRRENGRDVLKEIVFTEEWTPEDYRHLLGQLRNCTVSGGAVFGAFRENNRLVGFASLEGMRRGSRHQYLQLSNLHVSAEYRGRGIGKKLLALVCDRACAQGVPFLYISAHSSEETQAFYRAAGCSEAAELMPDLFEQEPCDCHLELKTKYPAFNTQPDGET